MKSYFQVFFLLLLFVFSACTFFRNVEGYIPEEIVNIKLPDSSKVLIHPITHPIPVDRVWIEEEQSEQEISAKEFLVARAHQGQINALIACLDGHSVYSGGHDGKVVKTTLVEASNKDALSNKRFLKSEIILQAKKPVLAMALSPDENYLAVAQFSSIVVIDLKQKVIRYHLSQISGRILSIAWDPLGELLVFGRANGDVFAWNIKNQAHAGENSIEAIERYGTGSSPTVGFAFHPSGQAFFAAERSGRIRLWRLFRTETKMGLRDKAAVKDIKDTSTLNTTLGQLSSSIEDLWLNSNASLLYAASSDGYIYRWKIRGLKNLPRIFVGVDSVFSLQGMNIKDFSHANNSLSLIATSGRGQRIQFWCQEQNQKLLDKSVKDPSVVIIQAPPIPSLDQEQEDRELLEESASDSLQQASTPSSAQTKPLTEQKPGLLAESELFREPLNIIRYASSSTQPSAILWGAEKTGNLLVFDASVLLNPTLVNLSNRYCQEDKGWNQ